MKKILTINVMISILVILFFTDQSCKSPSSAIEKKKTYKFSEVKHPDWSKNAVIYEVNVRQYTPEGTFAAFQNHLPRLKEMGVDILWLMPVNPIGIKNRKGKLGSYYSVKDYMAINPEFGNMDDFKNLVKEIHKQGMYVIIDWVANHTAWDNKLINEHTDWYAKDSTGKISSQYDWTDVAKLNYSNKKLREYMAGAMKFWITETDIDGFRCDVAGLVPTDFWNDTRKELQKVKPVFMLAEAEKPELTEKAFDMEYGWGFMHVSYQIAREKKDVRSLDSLIAKQDTIDPKNAMKMYFTSNHDENSWNGTEFEKYKKGNQAFAVLSATLPGMLMIYSGQEAGLSKRLRFFERDTIDWKDLKYSKFYKNLILIKKQNQALWNGGFAGDYNKVNTSDSTKVLAFLREKDGNRIFIIVNLSNDELMLKFNGDNFVGSYRNCLNSEKFEFNTDSKLKLGPWKYLVFEGVQ